MWLLPTKKVKRKRRFFWSRNNSLNQETGQIVYILMVILIIVLFLVSNLFLLRVFNERIVRRAIVSSNSETILFDLVKTFSNIRNEKTTQTIKIKISDQEYKVKNSDFFLLNLMEIKKIYSERKNEIFWFFWGRDLFKNRIRPFIQFGDSPYKLKIYSKHCVIRGDVFKGGKKVFSDSKNFEKNMRIKFSTDTFQMIKNKLMQNRNKCFFKKYSSESFFKSGKNLFLGPGCFLFDKRLILKGSNKPLLIDRFCQIIVPDIYLENAKTNSLFLAAESIELHNVKGNIQVFASHTLKIVDSVLENPSIISFLGEKGNIVIKNSIIKGSVFVFSSKKNKELNVILNNSFIKGVGIFQSGVMLKNKVKFSGAFYVDYVYYNSSTGIPVFNKLKNIILQPLDEQIIIPFGVIGQYQRNGVVFVYKK